jgi:hypothetical protein
LSENSLENTQEFYDGRASRFEPGPPEAEFLVRYSTNLTIESPVIKLDRLFHTVLGMGPGPLKLGILATFCPNWEFQKLSVL